jgi:hypothetical protein
VAQLHLLVAVGAALAGAAVTVLAGVGWARQDLPRLWLDRAILLAEALVLAGIVTGALDYTLRGLSGPDDPLHLLYAVLIAVALPIARFGGRLPARRRAAALAGAGVLVMAFFVRLLQTG